MKAQICAILSAFLLSISASGQCAKPEMNAVWDTGKQQFVCVAPAGQTLATSNDSTVSPKGDKKFCSVARDNLIKACPSSNDGKACKDRAKSIFNSCYKDFKAQESTSTTNQGPRTDPATCMQTYVQQQQACQARKLPPPSPGQPYIPDTCLQDAQAQQSKCLANANGR
jgi:hypothetical protein